MAYSPLSPQLTNAVRYQVLIVGFFIHAFVYLAYMIFAFYLSKQYSDISEVGALGLMAYISEIESYDKWTQIMASLNGFSSIGFGVIFIVWFSRAYYNLDRITGKGADYRPGWSIAGWLVPIIFLWYPVMLMREMIRRFYGILKLFPEHRASQIMEPNKMDKLALMWWLGWLGLSFIGSMIVRYNQPTSLLGAMGKFSGFYFSVGFSSLLSLIALGIAYYFVSQFHKLEDQIQTIWDSGEFEEKRNAWLDAKSQNNPDLKASSWYDPLDSEQKNLEKDPFEK